MEESSYVFWNLSFRGCRGCIHACLAFSLRWAVGERKRVTLARVKVKKVRKWTNQSRCTQVQKKKRERKKKGVNLLPLRVDRNFSVSFWGACHIFFALTMSRFILLKLAIFQGEFVILTAVQLCCRFLISRKFSGIFWGACHIIFYLNVRRLILLKLGIFWYRFVISRAVLCCTISSISTGCQALFSIGKSTLLPPLQIKSAYYYHSELSPFLLRWSLLFFIYN